MEFSSKFSAIYTKWCAQSFPGIFGFFAIFDHNFSKIVAPASDENGSYVMHLNEQTRMKKTL